MCNTEHIHSDLLSVTAAGVGVDAMGGNLFRGPEPGGVAPWAQGAVPGKCVW